MHSFGVADVAFTFVAGKLFAAICGDGFHDAVVVFGIVGAVDDVAGIGVEDCGGEELPSFVILACVGVFVGT